MPNNRRAGDFSTAIFIVILLFALQQEAKGFLLANHPKQHASFFNRQSSIIRRQLLASRSNDEPSSSPSPPIIVGNVETIQTSLELLNAMAHNEEQLLVIKYFASYCQLCRRAGIHYKQLASKCSDNSNIRWTRFEGTQLSGDDLRALGLTKFPFVQIYRRGRCVASFSAAGATIGPAFRKKVQETVDMCLGRSEEEWKCFQEEFASEIRDNREGREMLRSKLLEANEESRSPQEEPAVAANSKQSSLSSVATSKALKRKSKKHTPRRATSSGEVARNGTAPHPAYSHT